LVPETLPLLIARRIVSIRHRRESRHTIGAAPCPRVEGQRAETLTAENRIKECQLDLYADRTKVIRSEATEFRYEREAQPLPKIGPWRDQLDQLLLTNEAKASRERLTLIRLFEELRGQGYDGGYDAVRRYARQWSKKGSLSHI
jgi:hypothetical protein